MKIKIKSLLKGCFIGITLSTLLLVLFLERKQAKRREKYYTALCKNFDDASYGW